MGLPQQWITTVNKLAFVVLIAFFGSLGFLQNINNNTRRNDNAFKYK